MLKKLLKIISLSIILSSSGFAVAKANSAQNTSDWSQNHSHFLSPHFAVALNQKKSGAPLAPSSQGLAYQVISVTDEPILNDKPLPPNKKLMSLYIDNLNAWIMLKTFPKNTQQQFIFYKPNGQIYNKQILGTATQTYSNWLSYASVPMGNNISVADTGLWKVVFQLKYPNKDWQSIAEQTFDIEQQ